MKIHKRIFKRNDGRDLLLYGHKPHTEKNTVELEVMPLLPCLMRDMKLRLLMI